jgi:hypothetical protein
MMQSRICRGVITPIRKKSKGKEQQNIEEWEKIPS